jgi:hypothetical protein
MKFDHSHKIWAGIVLLSLLFLVGGESGSFAQSLPKARFAAASVLASSGLNCKLHPPGSPPSAGVTVLTSDDGYARFYAAKKTVSDAINRLTLDCVDATGKPSSYSVDLTSNATFAPNSLNLANLPGADRLALSRDPLSYAQSELLEAGYGLRPDPVKNAKGYALWLAASSQPGRILDTRSSVAVQPQHTSVSPRIIPSQNIPIVRPNDLPAGITVQQHSNWYGSVLYGAQPYVFILATFNVPEAVPGGDQTASTDISIWDGLGGNGTGGGLIQFFVFIETTPTAATYGIKREFCCGDSFEQPFSITGQSYLVPSANDLVFDEAWYCDANGNQNINGGYGCNFFHNLTTGAIVSCTSPTGTPCSSDKAMPLCSSGNTPHCMVLGNSAEFIIENEAGLTDFYPTVNMEGWATNTAGASFGPGDDPAVTLLTDTNGTSHLEPYLTVGVNDSLAATCFKTSQSFAGPVATCAGIGTSPFPGGGGGGGQCYLNGIPINCPRCPAGGCRQQ